MGAAQLTRILKLKANETTSSKHIYSIETEYYVHDQEMAFKKHEIRKKRFVQRGSLFGLFSSNKRIPYKMNWKNRQRRTKQVDISLEYTYEVDLKHILNVLSDLISSGKEMYSGELKSLENEDKSNKFNFIQSFTGTVHESKESEINGVLKLVIKSKL